MEIHQKKAKGKTKKERKDATEVDGDATRKRMHYDLPSTSSEKSTQIWPSTSSSSSSIDTINPFDDDCIMQHLTKTK